MGTAVGSRPLYLIVLLLSTLASGCLVLDLHPAYDDASLDFDEGLVGSWQDADDRVTLAIKPGEWRSYQLRYVHPVETGDLTGYLTRIGSQRFLDVMPARGEDRGSFVVPVHAAVRVMLDGDSLTIWPLSYDYLRERTKPGRSIPGLQLVLDQKENVIITSPTGALRRWLERLTADSPAVGPPAVFRRTTR